MVCLYFRLIVDSCHMFCCVQICTPSVELVLECLCNNHLLVEHLFSAQSSCVHAVVKCHSSVTKVFHNLVVPVASEWNCHWGSRVAGQQNIPWWENFCYWGSRVAEISLVHYKILRLYVVAEQGEVCFLTVEQQVPQSRITEWPLLHSVHLHLSWQSQPHTRMCMQDPRYVLWPQAWEWC